MKKTIFFSTFSIIFLLLLICLTIADDIIIEPIEPINEFENPFNEPQPLSESSNIGVLRINYTLPFANATAYGRSNVSAHITTRGTSSFTVNYAGLWGSVRHNLTALGYTNLAMLDGVTTNFTSSGSNHEPFGTFNFTIPIPTEDIKWIFVTMTQAWALSTQSTAEPCKYFISNFSNSVLWEYGTHVVSTTLTTRSVNITSEISNYIQDGKLSVHSVGIDMDIDEGCVVDFVGITIGYEEKKKEQYISTCSVLDIEGMTYYLTENIIGSDAEVCMNITANNVVLDCQNYTIEGDMYLGRYGIDVYRENEENTNVTIRNCKLTGWKDAGLRFYKSNNNTITNNTAEENIHYGIFLHYSSHNIITNNTAKYNGEYNIYLVHSSNNNIINNIVVDGRTDGLGVRYGSYNTIANNIINHNEHGIYLFDSHYNTITNNTANYNLCGINLYDNSNHNTIIDNTVNYNNLYGIRFEYSFYNSIYNNTANHNEHGIYLYGGLYSTIANNTVNYNNQVGIYIEFSRFAIIDNIINHNEHGIYIYGSSYNTIANNIISNNYVGFGYSYYSLYNSIYNNFFNNTNNFGIYFPWIEGNYWNTTKQEGKRIYSQGTHIGGNYWVGYSDICDDTNGDGFCDDPYVLDENNIDYLPYSDKYGYIPPTTTTTTITMNVSKKITYYCVGDYSIERIEEMGEITETALYCVYGCSEKNVPNFVVGRIPNGDLCNIDPFWINLFTLVGIVLMFGFLYWLYRRVG